MDYSLLEDPVWLLRDILDYFGHAIPRGNSQSIWYDNDNDNDNDNEKVFYCHEDT